MILEKFTSALGKYHFVFQLFLRVKFFFFFILDTIQQKWYENYKYGKEKQFKTQIIRDVAPKCDDDYN